MEQNVARTKPDDRPEPASRAVLRSINFKPDDPDSILILQFSKAPGGAKVDLVHINVPVQDHRGVAKGWPLYYWKPWKKYLAAKAKRRL
jgi:hypothetical protein